MAADRNASRRRSKYGAVRPRRALVTQDRNSGIPARGNLAVALPAWESARVPELTRIEALAELAAAFDLAESQSPGHSARIAYLATAVADRLGLDAPTRERILVAALL